VPLQRNPALLLRAQIPRSNVGQVAHVSPTPWVTLQEADITRRAPEVTCWLRLGCWSNNSANSHPSLGVFNRRVLHSCLVPQCSNPPYRPRHQRRLANCAWMPAFYTSGQPSNPCRHPACWASSQWSHTVSSTPCYGAWTPALLSTHPSMECRCTAPQIETPFVPAAQHLISSSENNIRPAQWAGHQWNAEWRTTLQDSAFSSPTLAPTHPGITLPASASVTGASAPVCRNGIWPSLRFVSVTQKNKPLTMLSSNVQPVDLLMDCTAWRLWTMRQSNGCSTPVPGSRRPSSG